jgi:hypothetical protein
LVTVVPSTFNRAFTTYFGAPKMAKSISVIPKKRGRPATGRDPAIPVRLPPEMVEQLEELASRRKTTRSQVIRELLEKALKRSK